MTAPRGAGDRSSLRRDLWCLQVPLVHQGPREPQGALPLRPNLYSNCGSLPSAVPAGEHGRPSAARSRALADSVVGRFNQEHQGTREMGCQLRDREACTFSEMT